MTKTPDLNLLAIDARLRHYKFRDIHDVTLSWADYNAMRAEIITLRHARDEAMRVAYSLADRVAAQSDLLSRRAERKPEQAEPVERKPEQPAWDGSGCGYRDCTPAEKVCQEGGPHG